MLANPEVQGLFYQKHGEVVATGLTDFSDPATTPLLTLTGGAYAPLVGQDSTGKWYRDLAALKGLDVTTLLGMMPGIDTLQTFGLHPQNPWPDALTLDGDEIITAQNAVNEFNGYISDAVTANGFALFDANALFDEISEHGYDKYVIHLTTEFARGGLFSFDGVHPSNVGYAVIANEFIEAINSKFGVDIVKVNVPAIANNPIIGKVNAADIKHDIFSLSPTIEMLGGKIK